MFGDFSDQCGDILFDVLIRVLQTRQYSGEDFCLNNHLSQGNRVFGNLLLTNLEYYTEYSENFIYLHFFLKLKKKMNKYMHVYYA